MEVEVIDGGNEPVVFIHVSFVEHGVVNGQIDMGRGRDEVNAQLHRIALYGLVFLGLQHNLDVFVIHDAAVALRDQEKHVHGLVALHLDAASGTAVAEHLADERERVAGLVLRAGERPGTVRVALVLHL